MVHLGAAGEQFFKYTIFWKYWVKFCSFLVNNSKNKEKFCAPKARAINVLSYFRIFWEKGPSAQCERGAADGNFLNLDDF